MATLFGVVLPRAVLGERAEPEGRELVVEVAAFSFTHRIGVAGRGRTSEHPCTISTICRALCRAANVSATAVIADGVQQPADLRVLRANTGLALCLASFELTAR